MEVFNRPIYVGRLFAFIAAAQEQHAGRAQHRVVHPISRPQSIRSSDTPSRRDLQSPKFPRESRSIRTAILARKWASKPVTDHIFSRSGDIPTNLNHASSVAYKLQPRKPESNSLAQRFAIAEVPKRKPVNPHSNSRSQMGIQTSHRSHLFPFG